LGEVTVNAIAYDEGAGTTDGDTQNENFARLTGTVLK
jgi:hypothetical protein